MRNIVEEYNKEYSKIDGFSTAIGVGITTDSLFSSVYNLYTILANSLSRIMGVFNSSSKRIDNIDKNKLNVYGEELFKQYKKVEYIINNVQYSNIKNVKISTVVGLDMPLKEASELVTTALTKYYILVPTELKELQQFLLDIVANPDSRLATRPKHVDKTIILANKDISNILNAVINPKSYLDYKMFKDLLPSVSSLGLVYDILLKQSSGTAIKELNIIKEETQVCSKLANDLWFKVKNKEIETLSANNLKYLGEVLENSAKLVTNYITLIYLYNELVKTTYNVVKRLEP